MPQSSNVQSVCTTDQEQPCQCGTSAETATAKTLRSIGAKPSFENGYITMDKDGLAIAMIPKQS